jgi:succinate dehydrogenase/fumarate reductase-like Fe-S protein
MRGDMGECLSFTVLARKLIVIYRWRCGGCVCGSCYCEAPSSVRPHATSDLKTYNVVFLSINLVVVTPLCENLPGPSANKPGDM